MQRHLSDEELLTVLSPRAPERGRRHLAACPDCRRRAQDLERLLAALPPPRQQPARDGAAFRQWAQARPAAGRRGRAPVRTLGWAAVLTALLLAAGLSLPFRAPATPVAGPATRLVPLNPAFRRDRVVVYWQPASPTARLELHLTPPPHPARPYLEVWFIEQGHHVPVASIPLAAPPAQMTVRVPHPRWPYSAVGVTMEASPYVRHPSNRRVFFAPLANRKSTGYPQA